MCCLFGMLDYDSNLSANKKNRILSVLAKECEQRGTDATGISYMDNDKLIILKAPVSAHNFKFNIPRNTNIVMGHTRFTTKGSEKNNYNNHPFMGTAGNTHFSLAHNGILYNDTTLKRTENLPDSRIETDSYVAVQLLEKHKNLNFNSIKNMAEKVEGSFSFTIHDDKDNLYFVKGDNPLCIYNFIHMGIYLYASTEDVQAMIKQETVLDIFRYFTIFSTDKKFRKFKVVCRYQQYEGANMMVERVKNGKPKKRLDLAFSR